MKAHPDLSVDIESEGGLQQQEEAIRAIQGMRVRATSSMINVGLLGETSSGKSFLIGGLLNRLEYTPVRNEDNMISDQYIGLLYSASEPTSACPVKIVPVDQSNSELDASGRGFLRVKFADTHEWENIGNSPLPAIVAAYTSQDPDAIARGRLALHRERIVAEAEILLSEPGIPAMLYDLPGYGGLYPIHDEIANNAWADADCFIYTVPATRVLNKSLDQKLISRLYMHHVASGKPVIWVLTGIDRANMLHEGRQAWKSAVEVCDSKLSTMLRETLPNLDHLNTFIGSDGFIPVSSGWEAQGRRKIENGEIEEGNILMAASRMKRLRRALSDLIYTRTGSKHIVAVTYEARNLLAPRQRGLSEVLDSARLPLKQLSVEYDHLNHRLSQLKFAINTISEQLEDVLQRHIKNTGISFDGLPDYLHQELDADIQAANLTKESEATQIEVRKSQLLQEWAVSHGPVRTWDKEFGDFVVATLEIVRAKLRETDPLGGLGSVSARVDLGQLRVIPSKRYRSDTKDVMQKISGFVSLSTPLASALAAGVGILTGPLLAVPAGITLTAAIIYTEIRRRKTAETALDALRKEWLDGLNDAAKQYQDLFLASARVRGQMVIDRAIELLSERRYELSRKVVVVEGRLADSDIVGHSDLIAQLEPYCQQGEELLSDLDQLTAQHTI